MDHADDAGVYKLTDDLAIIQTVDFFTPVVDDPFMFGQIAAANALSDVYAMGGTPLCAMNIVCFPVQTMPLSALNAILEGGLKKVEEAGAVLVGGHSVEDPELKYGLSVTGVVHPDRLITNQGLRPGDALVLTKPLGTGIIATALKGELAHDDAVGAMTKSMAQLNNVAAETMAHFDVSAATDVTGFGLAGHAFEMLAGSSMGLSLESAALPVLPHVLEYAGIGLLPAGLSRNRCYWESALVVDPAVPAPRVDLLWDPQTSGGLLIAVADGQAEDLVARLTGQGLTAAKVAEARSDPKEKIRVV